MHEEALEKIRKGITIEEEYTTLPAGVTNVIHNETSTGCDVTIVEGKNRQVRKMFEAVGHRVIALQRVSIGPLQLGSLPAGSTRPFNNARDYSNFERAVRNGDDRMQYC